MPIRHPPRKEPRVLALLPGKNRLVFAVVDPWEVRSLGEVLPRPGSHVLPLRRLLRREKPTVIVAEAPSLAEALAGAARVVGAPVVTTPLRPVSRAWARALYPELPLYGLRPEGDRAARLAIAAVLQSSIPSRTYAPTRRNRTVRRDA